MGTILLIVGSVLPLISSVVYVLSIIKGDTRPQRATRFLIALITGLSFFALWSAGDGYGMWLALVSFMQALAICVLAVKRGIGGHAPLDILCSVLCGIGLVAWWLTGESVVGLAAAIFADFVAIVPALVKTWRLPNTETWLFYGLDCAAGLCVLVAAPLDLLHSAYPLYIVFANAVFVWAILRPRALVH
ncbi:MAG TPA: hypothetical protein VFO38_03220 [Candidatus Saccharimonadales bacterium]|nr:hypothetical protein [Candidatus Saccharimonadales bacterium]